MPSVTDREVRFICRVTKEGYSSALLTKKRCLKNGKRKFECKESIPRQRVGRTSIKRFTIPVMYLTNQSISADHKFFSPSHALCARHRTMLAPHSVFSFYRSLHQCQVWKTIICFRGKRCIWNLCERNTLVIYSVLFFRFPHSYQQNLHLRFLH